MTARRGPGRGAAKSAYCTGAEPQLGLGDSPRTLPTFDAATSRRDGPDRWPQPPWPSSPRPSSPSLPPIRREKRENSKDPRPPKLSSPVALPPNGRRGSNAAFVGLPAPLSPVRRGGGWERGAGGVRDSKRRTEVRLASSGLRSCVGKCEKHPERLLILFSSGPVLQPFLPGLLSNLIPLLWGYWSLGVLLKESFQGEVMLRSGDISSRHLGHACPLLVGRGVKLRSPRLLVFDDLLLEIGRLLWMDQSGAIDSDLS
jgi:hypothetical protein